MKAKAEWLARLALVMVVTLISAACGNGAADNQTADNAEAAEATAMMSSYAEQQGAAEQARAKDPAWKPSCVEVGLIQVGDDKRPGSLKNFCLNAEGNILACFAPVQGEEQRPSEAEPKPGIRVYSPAGELLRTLPLEIRPGAICVAEGGNIFVAGDGRLLKLDAAGKVLVSAVSPVAVEPVVVSKEMQEMLKESGRSNTEEVERLKGSMERRRRDVTGLAVTAQDVFVAVPSPNDFTYRVYRFDHQFQNSKLVVEKLRGCCGQMDIQARDGRLWIPHNARHQVESRDRDGKELTKFGRAGRVKAADFGGCCEPKNMRVLPNGDLLVAESGPPTCIKRFSADGKFLGVMAVAVGKGDCVRVTVEASADGLRYFLLDTAHDAIRVFGGKG